MMMSKTNKTTNRTTKKSMLKKLAMMVAAVGVVCALQAPAAEAGHHSWRGHHSYHGGYRHRVSYYGPSVGFYVGPRPVYYRYGYGYSHGYGGYYYPPRPSVGVYFRVP